MSSFPGTLLLLYHIKELETGERYSPIDFSQKLHFPFLLGIHAWGPFWGQEPVAHRRLSPMPPPPCQARVAVEFGFRNLEICHLNRGSFSVHICQPWNLRTDLKSKCWDVFSSWILSRLVPSGENPDAGRSNMGVTHPYLSQALSPWA